MKALILIALIVGCYFLLHKSKDKKNNNVSNIMATRCVETPKVTKTEFVDELKVENTDENIKKEPPKRKGFEILLDTIPHEIVLKNTESPALKRKLASEIGEIRFSSVTKSSNLITLSNFVVIDIETTGIALSNRIIEICALQFEDCMPVACFSTLINPGRKIPPDATEINGITEEMVKDAPTLNEIYEQLQSFVGKLPIVAHNAAFDMRHLYASGISFGKNRIFDTLTLAKKELEAYNSRRAYRDDYEWDVDDYKLETLCNYYGLYRDKAHRAESDCLATGFLFQELCSERIDEYDEKFCSYILSRHEETVETADEEVVN